MPVSIKIGSGFRQATPKLRHNNVWREAIAWTFSQGVWRRTFAAEQVNLIPNSRLMGGTDYFTYPDGTVRGYAPTAWSMYYSYQGSAYATYSYNDQSMGRSYRFITDVSRLFMQNRTYAQVGKVYHASVVVEKINSYGTRKIVDIYPDVTNQQVNIQYIKPWPKLGDINEGDRISCAFTVDRDGIVQFNIGAGVDALDSIDIQFSAPQISVGYEYEYIPTPENTPYYTVSLQNSYFHMDEVIVTQRGTHYLESSVSFDDTIYDQQNDVFLFARSDSASDDGISIRTYTDRTQELLVWKDGQIIERADLTIEIETTKQVGIGLWFDIESGYGENIRLFVDGSLAAHIPGKTFTPLNIDGVFGSSKHKSSKISVGQFVLYVNEQLICFNLEEGSGNSLISRCSDFTATINGVEGQDFVWDGLSPPTITLQPVDTPARLETVATLYSDATSYTQVQWYVDNVPIFGATNKVLQVSVDLDYDFSQEYYAVYKNKYGYTNTNRVKITEAVIPIITEDGQQLLTEDGQALVAEDLTPLP